MSGFFGIVRGDGAPVERDLLDRIAKALQFRGPAATSVCVQDGAGFCFTFLRTGPAPQSRTQPYTLDGNVWLIGDIRLDGRDDLKRSLEAAGENPSRTATDEELVLHAWRAWGEEAPKRLLGDFAFAVWDRTAGRVCCFRDLIGIRPFFYAATGKFIAFTNTLDVLRLAPGVDLSLDDAWVGDFLLQGFSSYQDRTVYRGVKRLPAAHKLTFAEQQGTVARYTSLPIEEPVFYHDPSQYIEQFRHLLTQAVRDRLPEGNVASFMSGGLDSTSVTAVAAKLMGAQAAERLRAFTIDLNSVFPDEEPAYAKQVADHIGMPIEFAPLGDELPYSSWSHPDTRTAEPSQEAFYALTRALYQHVSRFAVVVLAGDGGDSILTGKVLPFLGHALRKGGFLAALNEIGRFVRENRRWPVWGTGLRGRWRNWKSRRNGEGLPHWVDPGFIERLNLRERWHALQQSSEPEHPLHPGTASFANGYWAAFMEQEDAGWTGARLQRRSPFLDRRLIEFLLRVPPVPSLMHKDMLRRAMKDELSEPVRNRRKTPLASDPTVCQIQRLRWCPEPISKPHTITESYINWSKVSVTLAERRGSNWLAALQPVSLHVWVKAVENHYPFG
jgi:asparagine synthase (glutamine-hydrolysing)